MSATPNRLVVSALSMSAALLLLAGCAAGSPDNAAPPAYDVEGGQSDSATDGGTNAGTNEGLGARTVTVELAGQSFTFATSSCMVTEEDALISGAGTDESGEPAYLSIDFYSLDQDAGGGARIDLGTDQPFTSSDESYTVDVFPGGDFTLTTELGSFEFEAEFQANDGSSVGPGIVRAACV